MLTAIRNWVIRTMMKSKGETGIVRTLPNRDIVELNTQITAQRLMQNGIDPQSLKNADQVENAIIAIESRPKVQEGIKSTGKVFDMEGKEIPKGSKIMGGKQITDKDPELESIERLRRKNENFLQFGPRGTKSVEIQITRDLVKRILDKKGIQTGGRDPIDVFEESIEQGDAILTDIANIADDIKAGFKPKSIDDLLEREGLFNVKITKEPNPIRKPSNPLGDTLDDMEKNIKTRLEKQNKEGISRIRERQKMIENSIDNQSPGFSGDRKVDAVLVAEEMAERMGKVYDDLPIKEQTKLYGEAFDALSKKRFDPPDDMAQGGRAGFFMGSPNPKGLGLLRALLNFFGKKSDVVKNPSDLLKKTNPKKFNKILEDAKGKVIPKEGIMATDRIKGYQTEMAKDRVEAIRDLLETGKRIKADDDKILTYKNQVKNNFMKDLKMSEADAEKAADRMVRFARDVTRAQKTPEITEEGILQLENVLKNMETGGKKKRDLNADGGRIGFKDGMTRRTFLKILGGAMAIPIVGKFLKPFKTSKGVTKVPIIKTDNVPGKPEWFDQLVNKVIIEGDDVTKKLATGERQTVHQKTLDDGTVVRVTEDIDNGAVRVEYQSEKNVFGDDVLMQYKKPLPDQEVPNPRAQFITSESGPVGRRYGPDDYEIDVDEVVGTSIRDLDSDVSKLKQYATGKGPTMKEILQNKKRQDRAKAISEDMEAQSDAVIRRQGEADDSYYGDPEELASGGIARMLGE